MTGDIFACQLGIDGAMWLVDGNKDFIILAGYNGLEGLGVEIKIMFVWHCHRNDRNFWQGVQNFFLSQVQSMLNRGGGGANIWIASKFSDDNVLDNIP